MSKIIVSFLLLSSLFITTGCNRISGQDQMTRFDETFRIYSKHLRWGHFHEISGLLTPKHIEPALAKIPSLKNIRVSSVEPIKWIVAQNKEKLSGTVKISYYVTDRGVIRETHQQQTWLWNADTKIWKLDNSFPEFKN